MCKFINDKQTNNLLAKVETKYSRVSFLMLGAIVFYFLFFVNCNSCERTGFIPNIKLNEQASNKEKGNHALWFQVGLGLASAKINHRYYPEGTFLHGEFNVHFRRRHRVIAIGLDGEGIEAWGINTLWGSYGYSYHLPTFEAALSAGIGFSSWYNWFWIFFRR